MDRRDILRLGFAGGTLALLGRACQTGPRDPAPPPPSEDEPVYALASGDSLYDDLDGHGCHQTYDGRDQAASGALSENLWIHDEGSRIIEAEGRGFVLEIGCVGQMSAYAWLVNPREIDFADFGSLRADVRLDSRSTGEHPFAGLNFHTTIPEQPPGRSWYVTLGLFKDPSVLGAMVLGVYGNLNLGLLESDILGTVGLDEWHALRLDICTRADDPRLGDQDIRLDYYLDGALLASRIPEDSALLIDPNRTELGPHRSLLVVRDEKGGDAYAGFDNVRARYRDRIA
jgi:hypothetical protein